MNKARIVWTLRARADLRAIMRFIARNAPRTARRFIARLRDSVERLRTAPLLGAIVTEVDDPAIREILYGNYRIIYRAENRRVVILTVWHGARLLDRGDFEGG